MKNDYCKLSQKEIHALPERFKGFLLSPFQLNQSNRMVAVPEDTFTEMIEIIAEYAAQAAHAGADTDKPLYSTRMDAARFQRAIALEDNAETLYAAVLNNAPDAIAIRREFDAALAATEKKEPRNV